MSRKKKRQCDHKFGLLGFVTDGFHYSKHYACAANGRKKQKTPFTDTPAFIFGR